MILVDLNQTIIAGVMQQLKMDKSQVLNEDLVRHLVLNILRSYNKKFKSKYGEMILCCDSKNYWRREYFPLYKANRKINRDKSFLDWSLIFKSLATIRMELQTFGPYKLVWTDGAEADDIIATIVKNTSKDEPILILSSDKDFVQLHIHPNVKQYSPILQKFISEKDPYRYIKQHIILGDAKDGVPNILSSNDCFVTKKRQSPIRKAKLETWLKQDPAIFCTDDTMLSRYKRNEMLIDLTMIPDTITNRILEEYSTSKGNNKNTFLNYLITYRLKNLISCIEEFN